MLQRHISQDSDLPAKPTKKVQLGIYCTQIWLGEHNDLMPQDFRTVNAASNGYGNSQNWSHH